MQGSFQRCLNPLRYTGKNKFRLIDVVLLVTEPVPVVFYSCCKIQIREDPHIPKSEFYSIFASGEVILYAGGGRWLELFVTGQQDIRGRVPANA